jgi:polyisoprenoid-binding protein YceI
MSVIATALPPDLNAGTWVIDPSHSLVEFTIRHLMVSKVRGSFGTFSGAITLAEDPSASSVEVTIDPDSVDTRDRQRDDHLRSADFFHVGSYPTWTFKSTAVEPDGDNWRVTGDLTIRGITRPVSFVVEYNGTQAHPMGGVRAGFSAELEISRKDWGISFNAALEGGGVMVGDKVKINLEVEAALQEPAVQA